MASLRSRRLAPGVAPTLGVSGSPAAGARGPGGRPDVGGARADGGDRPGHAAAALHAAGVTIRALREGDAALVPGRLWVGIDQAADRAVLGGDLRLDPARGPAV